MMSFTPIFLGLISSVAYGIINAILWTFFVPDRDLSVAFMYVFRRVIDHNPAHSFISSKFRGVQSLFSTTIFLNYVSRMLKYP